MELIETRSNAWGQEVPEGANLDLVAWCALAGLLLIVGHAAVKAWSRRRGRPGT